MAFHGLSQLIIYYPALSYLLLFSVKTASQLGKCEVCTTVLWAPQFEVRENLKFYSGFNQFLLIVAMSLEIFLFTQEHQRRTEPVTLIISYHALSQLILIYHGLSYSGQEIMLMNFLSVHRNAEFPSLLYIKQKVRERQ